MRNFFKNILLVVSGKRDDETAIEEAVKLAVIANSSIKIVKMVDNLEKYIEVSSLILPHMVNV
jgi:tRNA C32,U32 (ribose-2'-O)-methylase TrmJ